MSVHTYIQALGRIAQGTVLTEDFYVHDLPDDAYDEGVRYDRWFWNPATKQTHFAPKRGDHAETVKAHPEWFGLTPEQVESHDLTMDGMNQLITLVLRQGWVRINVYSGDWYFHAATARALRRAAEFYRDYIEADYNTVTFDAGLDPDAGHPHVAVSCDRNPQRFTRFLKTGTIGDEWTDTRLKEVA